MDLEYINTRRNELLRQRVELEQTFLKLDSQRTQITADLNATNGAIQFIEELIKKSDARTSS